MDKRSPPDSRIFSTSKLHPPPVFSGESRIHTEAPSHDTDSTNLQRHIQDLIGENRGESQDLSGLSFLYNSPRNRQSPGKESRRTGFSLRDSDSRVAKSDRELGLLQNEVSFLKSLLENRNLQVPETPVYLLPAEFYFSLRESLSKSFTAIELHLNLLGEEGQPLAQNYSEIKSQVQLRLQAPAPITLALMTELFDFLQDCESLQQGIHDQYQGLICRVSTDLSELLDESFRVLAPLANKSKREEDVSDMRIWNERRIAIRSENPNLTLVLSKQRILQEFEGLKQRLLVHVMGFTDLPSIPRALNKSQTPVLLRSFQERKPQIDRSSSNPENLYRFRQSVEELYDALNRTKTEVGKWSWKSSPFSTFSFPKVTQIKDVDAVLKVVRHEIEEIGKVIVAERSGIEEKVKRNEEHELKERERISALETDLDFAQKSTADLKLKLKVSESAFQSQTQTLDNLTHELQSYKDRYQHSTQLIETGQTKLAGIQGSYESEKRSISEFIARISLACFSGQAHSLKDIEEQALTLKRNFEETQEIAVMETFEPAFPNLLHQVKLRSNSAVSETGITDGMEHLVQKTKKLLDEIQGQVISPPTSDGTAESVARFLVWEIEALDTVENTIFEDRRREKTLEGTVATRDKEIAIKTHQLQSLEIQSGRFRSDLEAAVSKLTAENAVLKTSLADKTTAQQRAKEMEKKNQDLSTNNLNLLETIHVREAEKTKLNQRYMDSEYKCIEKENQNQALQSVISALRSELAAKEIAFDSDTRVIIPETMSQTRLKTDQNTEERLAKGLEYVCRRAATLSETTDVLPIEIMERQKFLYDQLNLIEEMLKNLREKEYIQQQMQEQLSEVQLQNKQLSSELETLNTTHLSLQAEKAEIINSLQEQLQTQEIQISGPTLTEETSPTRPNTFEAGISKGLQYLISQVRLMTEHTETIPTGIYEQEMCLAEELSTLESDLWKYKDRVDFLEAEHSRLSQKIGYLEAEHERSNNEQLERASETEELQKTSKLLEKQVQELSLKLDFIEELGSVHKKLAEREADYSALRQHLENKEVLVTSCDLSESCICMVQPSLALQDTIYKGFRYISQLLAEMKIGEFAPTLNMCESQYSIYQHLLLFKDKLRKLGANEYALETECVRLRSESDDLKQIIVNKERAIDALETDLLQEKQALGNAIQETQIMTLKLEQAEKQLENKSQAYSELLLQNEKSLQTLVSRDSTIAHLRTEVAAKELGFSYGANSIIPEMKSETRLQAGLSVGEKLAKSFEYVCRHAASLTKTTAAIPMDLMESQKFLYEQLQAIEEMFCKWKKDEEDQHKLIEEMQTEMNKLRTLLSEKEENRLDLESKLKESQSEAESCWEGQRQLSTASHDIDMERERISAECQQLQVQIKTITKQLADCEKAKEAETDKLLDALYEIDVLKIDLQDTEKERHKSVKENARLTKDLQKNQLEIENCLQQKRALEEQVSVQVIEAPLISQETMIESHAVLSLQYQEEVAKGLDLCICKVIGNKESELPLTLLGKESFLFQAIYERYEEQRNIMRLCSKFNEFGTSLQEKLELSSSRLLNKEQTLLRTNQRFLKWRDLYQQEKQASAKQLSESQLKNAQFSSELETLNTAHLSLQNEAAKSLQLIHSLEEQLHTQEIQISGPMSIEETQIPQTRSRKDLGVRLMKGFDFLIQELSQGFGLACNSTENLFEKQQLLYSLIRKGCHIYAELGVENRDIQTTWIKDHEAVQVLTLKLEQAEKQLENKSQDYSELLLQNEKSLQTLVSRDSTIAHLRTEVAAKELEFSYGANSIVPEMKSETRLQAGLSVGEKLVKSFEYVCRHAASLTKTTAAIPMDLMESQKFLYDQLHAIEEMFCKWKKDEEDQHKLIEEMQTEMNKLRTLLSEKEENRLDLESKLKETQSEVESSREGQRQLTTACHDIDMERERVGAECQQLQIQVKTITEQLADCEKAKVALETVLNYKLQTLLEDNNTLKSDLQRTRKQLSESATANANITGQARNNRMIVSTFAKQKRALEEQVSVQVIETPLISLETMIESHAVLSLQYQEGVAKGLDLCIRKAIGNKESELPLTLLGKESYLYQAIYDHYRELENTIILCSKFSEFGTSLQEKLELSSKRLLNKEQTLLRTNQRFLKWRDLYQQEKQASAKQLSESLLHNAKLSSELETLNTAHLILQTEAVKSLQIIHSLKEQLRTQEIQISGPMSIEETQIPQTRLRKDLEVRLMKGFDFLVKELSQGFGVECNSEHNPFDKQQLLYTLIRQCCQIYADMQGTLTKERDTVEVLTLKLEQAEKQLENKSREYSELHWRFSAQTEKSQLEATSHIQTMASRDANITHLENLIQTLRTEVAATELEFSYSANSVVPEMKSETRLQAGLSVGEKLVKSFEYVCRHAASLTKTTAAIPMDLMESQKFLYDQLHAIEEMFCKWKKDEEDQHKLIEEMQTEMNKLRTLLSEKEENRLDLESKLKETQSEVESSREGQRQLTTACHDIDMERERVGAECQQLQIQVKTITEQLADCEKAKVALETVLNYKLQTLLEDNNTLKSDLQRTRKQLSESATANANITGQARNNRMIVSTFAKQKRALEEQVSVQVIETPLISLETMIESHAVLSLQYQEGVAKGLDLCIRKAIGNKESELPLTLLGKESYLYQAIYERYEEQKNIMILCSKFSEFGTSLQAQMELSSSRLLSKEQAVVHATQRLSKWKVFTRDKSNETRQLRQECNELSQSVVLLKKSLEETQSKLTTEATHKENLQVKLKEVEEKSKNSLDNLALVLQQLQTENQSQKHTIDSLKEELRAQEIPINEHILTAETALYQRHPRKDIEERLLKGFDFLIEQLAHSFGLEHNPTKNLLEKQQYLSTSIRQCCQIHADLGIKNRLLQASSTKEREETQIFVTELEKMKTQLEGSCQRLETLRLSCISENEKHQFEANAHARNLANRDAEIIRLQGLIKELRDQVTAKEIALPSSPDSLVPERGSQIRLQGSLSTKEKLLKGFEYLCRRAAALSQTCGNLPLDMMEIQKYLYDQLDLIEKMCNKSRSFYNLIAEKDKQHCVQTQELVAIIVPKLDHHSKRLAQLQSSIPQLKAKLTDYKRKCRLQSTEILTLQQQCEDNKSEITELTLKLEETEAELKDSQDSAVSNENLILRYSNCLDRIEEQVSKFTSIRSNSDQSQESDAPQAVEERKSIEQKVEILMQNVNELMKAQEQLWSEEIAALNMAFGQEVSVPTLESSSVEVFLHTSIERTREVIQFLTIFKDLPNCITTIYDTTNKLRAKHAHSSQRPSCEDLTNLSVKDKLSRIETNLEALSLPPSSEVTPYRRTPRHGSQMSPMLTDIVQDRIQRDNERAKHLQMIEQLESELMDEKASHIETNNVLKQTSERKEYLENQIKIKEKEMETVVNELRMKVEEIGRGKIAPEEEDLSSQSASDEFKLLKEASSSINQLLEEMKKSKKDSVLQKLRGIIRWHFNPRLSAHFARWKSNEQLNAYAVETLYEGDELKGWKLSLVRNNPLLKAINTPNAQPEKPMYPFMVLKLADEILLRKAETEISEETEESLSVFTLKYMTEKYGSRVSALKMIRQMIPALWAFDENRYYGHLLARMFQIKNPLSDSLVSFLTKVNYCMKKLVGSRLEKKREGHFQRLEKCFESELTDPESGGILYLSDALTFLYSLPLMTDYLVCKRVISCLRDEDMDKIEYVAFVVMHKMNEFHMDPETFIASLDNDGSGVLITDLVKSLKLKLHLSISDKKLEATFRSMDERHTGKITQEEFIQLVGQVYYDLDSVDDSFSVERTYFLYILSYVYSRTVDENKKFASETYQRHLSLDLQETFQQSLADIDSSLSQEQINDLLLSAAKFDPQNPFSKENFLCVLAAKELNGLFLNPFGDFYLVSVKVKTETPKKRKRNEIRSQAMERDVLNYHRRIKHYSIIGTPQVDS